MEAKQKAMTALEIVKQCEWELGVLLEEVSRGEIDRQHLLQEVAVIALKLQEVASRKR